MPDLRALDVQKLQDQKNRRDQDQRDTGNQLRSLACLFAEPAAESEPVPTIGIPASKAVKTRVTQQPVAFLEPRHS